MTDYFTSDHFKLLSKWKSQKRDDSNPEQSRAYDELKKAYEVAEAWANAVKAILFPAGVVKVRKRPTSQANTFLPYNWARIYPSAEAPEDLAYTVGIDAGVGFVVKIDTVQADPALRARYEAIRGPFNSKSSIVAVLPIDQGLSKSLPELVAWSVEAIRGFKVRYDEVAARLGIGKILSDEDLLKHFDANSAFQTFRASWSAAEKALFCRLARAVHAAGLDWWHVGRSVGVRFGHKEPGSERAVSVLGVVRGVRARKISWTKQLGDVPVLRREMLTAELVDKIEGVLASHREELQVLLALEPERPGLWPDQLRDDLLEPSDDAEDEDSEDSDETSARRSFNRIYYGPPGTGKTYELSKLLKREYEQAMASVSQEEWRRQFIGDRIAGLTWWEGAAAALYDLGGKGKVADLFKHPFIQAISAFKGRSQNVRQTLWGTLQEHTVEDSRTVNRKLRFDPTLFDKSADSVWNLAGDWQEAGADIIQIVKEYRAGPTASGAVHRHSFVTFHQSYGYEEFVEGLRPILAGDGDAGEVRYKIRNGEFKELCNRARLEPDQRFAMVIDEINRGNISKIFGELITLIESDKREGAENAVSVKLPYSGDSFSVPKNVDIIGTMNTADRSLAMLDTALRRRFDFVAVMPDTRDEPGAPLYGLRVNLGEHVIDVPRMLAAINQRIEALYDRDHTIGHAYLTPLVAVPDGDARMVKLGEVFRNRIVPLLEEYFFSDWQKMRLVLADNQKAEDARFILASDDHESDLARLFGNDHGLDEYGMRRTYRIQISAFSSPEAYIGIYQTLAS